MVDTDSDLTLLCLHFAGLIALNGFSIQHYAGTVTYTADEFMPKV